MADEEQLLGEDDAFDGDNILNGQEDLDANDILNGADGEPKSAEVRMAPKLLGFLSECTILNIFPGIRDNPSTCSRNGRRS